MSEWRDLMCGEPRAADVGKTLTLSGWAARRRDHGGLVFVDLRDRSRCHAARREPRALARPRRRSRRRSATSSSSGRTGEVVARSPETVNPKMDTGEVELQVDELEIVSRSTPLPFQLDDEGVDETLRLRYRWLDLRTERMQRNLELSAKAVARYQDAHGGARLHRHRGRRA